jgi:uronate dehydrogenase
VTAPPPYPGTLALTGASGKVARLIAPHLVSRVARFRLSDRSLSPDVVELFTGAAKPAIVTGDLAEPGVAETILGDADALVHLAAISTEAPMADILHSNIAAVGHLFAAAACLGIRRVVLASSMHVMGFYDRSTPIDETMPAQPDSFYAVSKLFAENLGFLYAAKAGMSVTALRLGHVYGADDLPEPGNHIAPEDCAALILRALSQDEAGFRIVHAAATPSGGARVSNREFMPDSAYATPTEPSAIREARLLEWWGHLNTALRKRGGYFAALPLPGSDLSGSKK